MSAQQDDPGAEREIDLRSWWDALVSKRWYVVIGLVIGLVVGGLYSLAGGSTYTATAVIAPGQPLTPGGQPILTYQASPSTIEAIVTSESALLRAAAVAHMPVSQLRGHVSTSTIATGVGSTQSRAATLIAITVQAHKSKRAADAANALAQIVKHDTTSIYVTQSIAILEQKQKSFNAQLASIATLISAFNKALSSSNLDPINKLALVSELDAAIQRQGNLNDKLATVEEDLPLAQNIEIAQVVTAAAAHKTVARSRRNSLLFGGLIGLIAGGIVAIVVGLRAKRKHPEVPEPA